jgi:prepilin-type N-terminal cleavage/methylation domain-containing protein
MNTKAKGIRGFTLVELIVVIAIIAILAAVSIVGYQNYISRARLSNDTSDARNMNQILDLYLLSNNVDEEDLEASDIRWIVSQENDFSFIPRTKGYSYWYSFEEGIVVAPSYGSGEELGLEGTYLLADGDAKLEEIMPGKLLLDVGGSDLANALHGIRNLRNVTDFEGYVNSVDEALHDHLNDFHPDTTLFINDFFSLIGDSVDYVRRVVFSDYIDTVPNMAFQDIRVDPVAEVTIKLPISISMIESNALHGVTNIRLEYPNIDRIRVEENAFDPNDTLNTELRAKEGSGELLALDIDIQLTNPTYLYYHKDSNQYIGKRDDNIQQFQIIVGSGYLKMYDEVTGEWWLCYFLRSADGAGGYQYYNLEKKSDTTLEDYISSLYDVNGDFDGNKVSTPNSDVVRENSNGIDVVTTVYQKTLFTYYDGTHYEPSGLSYWLANTFYNASTKLPNSEDYVEIISSRMNQDVIEETISYYEYVDDGDFYTTFEGGLGDEVTDSNIDQMDDDIYLYDIFYSSTVSNSILSIYSYNRILNVQFANIDASVDAHSISVTYRNSIRGYEIGEVKIYNSDGRFVAKGELEFIRFN